MLPTSPYDAGKVDYITETVVNQYAGDCVCQQATVGEVRRPRERGDGGMNTGGTDTIWLTSRIILPDITCLLSCVSRNNSIGLPAIS